MSANKINKHETIFVTGTDTGVGKTLMTALLLQHYREQGLQALAMKPFCSGGRADARLLLSLQQPGMTLDEVNPFYFRQPVAPAAALQKEGGRISLRDTLGKIRELERRCEILLIEGSGGLMVPVDRNWTIADLVTALDCKTIVVARNRLGTINHTLLTLAALKARGIGETSVVMMREKRADSSARGNVRLIREFAPKTPVFELPYMGENASEKAQIKKIAKKIKKTLARF